MRLNIPAALVAAVVLMPHAALAGVTVTIANGNVSVSAQDATIRQILTEWARVGRREKGALRPVFFGACSAFRMGADQTTALAALPVDW